MELLTRSGKTKVLSLLERSYQAETKLQALDFIYFPSTHKVKGGRFMVRLISILLNKSINQGLLVYPS